MCSGDFFFFLILFCVFVYVCVYEMKKKISSDFSMWSWAKFKWFLSPFFVAILVEVISDCNLPIQLFLHHSDLSGIFTKFTSIKSKFNENVKKICGKMHLISAD